ncbi:lactoylglutathione lyase [Rhodanobacter thiooxydans]|nr:lactoylglutathione lyase [Rhodanobacter thiooxydans]EIL98365.1 lactoylglutathione lyase [Rhodanobacter thiooxydans LCS2]MCW0202660.1 hypothetical protein [Rhodanobacter thiooxydans]
MPFVPDDFSRGLREGSLGALYLANVRDLDGNKRCAIHRAKREA